MKLLIKLVLVLVILAALGVAMLFNMIDSLARRGIELAGTTALGVPTTLRTADIGVFGGRFDMAGLNVANPGGFQSPHFLNLNDGGVAVTLPTLRKDVVELPYLRLGGIDVNLERREGKSNYAVILDNIKKLESSTGGSGGGSKPQGGGAEKKFVIREVVVSDIKVHVDLLPIGGSLTRVDVPIQEIKLTNVGSGTTGGMVLRELLPTLLKAILAAAVQKGGDIIPGDVLGELQGSLAQLTSLESLGVGMAGDLQKQVEDLAGKAGEAVKGVQDTADKAKKAAEDAAKGLKDLVPKLP